MKGIILIFFFCNLFCIVAFAQQAVKLDEFQAIQCDEYLARMDSVINYSQNNPAAKVYIFVYEGRDYAYDSRKKGYELSLPAIGLAKAKIKSMKKYISRFKSEGIEKFVFVNAGFRENVGIEIWGVPENIAPPEPNPTLTKMKHRKGKPYGYCLYCCE